eukprot:1161936-Pelagomonas_calceolata.AAC.2
MRMRTHVHAELTQAISNVLEHSLHLVHFCEVDKAQSGTIGNEGADTCAHTAALMNTTNIALPGARDSFRKFYWLSFKFSQGHNSGSQHFHTAPTRYATNLTDKHKTHMYKRKAGLC